MKTAVSIPDPLYKRSEQFARRLKISRSELYARALQAYVRRHDREELARELKDFYAAEHPDPDPAIAASMVDVLRREKDEW
jgi:metal-responsive CopG/Arc/MetJ family transcriptional regulator